MHPDPLLLDSTLLVHPDTPFAQIRVGLSACGWAPDGREAATPPLIPGEPELVGYREPGGRLLTYTMNPVVRLRVLDAGLLTPAERADIATRVPVATDAQIEAALANNDARRRLWAIFAARERELFWMQPEIAKLVRDREPIVAQAAAETAGLLAQVAEARQRALAGLAMIEEMVRPLLEALAQPGGEALIAELKPQPADYARVFDAGLAPAIMHAYDRLWARPPEVDPGDGYPDLEIAAAPAGMFRSQNDVSWRFPQGYRAIAPWMDPHRTWIRWRYLPRGETGGGIAYDGLVWLEGRWAWFPKPFRVLPELVQRARAAGTTEH